MTIQRRFAPIGGRFEPEQVAGFTGIYTDYFYKENRCGIAHGKANV
jgi:hypothetical protein